ncbi:putative membrane protein [Acinetobacter baumannii 754286]|nr:putative membrane protein [Acinetobacter baumannii 754286]
MSFLVILIFIIICIAFGYFDLNSALRSLLLYLLLMQFGSLIFLIKTKFMK